jgi:riboflavin transporter FmnP
MKKEKLVKISVTGVFCALAFIMTVVLRFKVAFLSFDLKDTILAVIALMYGPLYAVVSAGIVAFLEFLSVSDTGVYGLIMNFISSAAFTFTAGIIYKYKRTFKGAVLSVVFSVISVCIVMCLANILITPYYMGVTSGEVVAMIPTLLLPFNLCKSLINAATTLIIYKPIRNIISKFGIKEQTVANKSNFKKSLILCIVALVVIVVTTIFLVMYLAGKIDFTLLKKAEEIVNFFTK